jgi:glycosyltransferase involved in cell wall biosynthesis
VVDSGSTDGTQAIAEEHGARVIFNEWPGYGPQKRFAEDQCRHEWLLNLDADEVVPPRLAGEIRALFRAGEPPAPGLPHPHRRDLPGERAPHPMTYSLAPVALYRKDAGGIPRPWSRPGRPEAGNEGRDAAGDRASPVRAVPGRPGGQAQPLFRSAAVDLEIRGVSIPTWRVFFELPAAFVKGLYRAPPRPARHLRLPDRHELRHLAPLRLAKHYEKKRLSALKDASKPNP